MSSRVKVSRSDIEEADFPPLCMICGVNAAESKHPTTLITTPFPLSLFGIAATVVSWKKTPLTVTTCNGCKQGYLNEANMGKVFATLYTLTWLFLIIVLSTGPHPDLLKVLVGPAIMAFCTILLHLVYFWGTGRKYAIRLDQIDKNYVAISFPTGKWGVAYTTWRHDKPNRIAEQALALKAEKRAAARPDTAVLGEPVQDQGPLPPGGVTVSDMPAAPPPGVPKKGPPPEVVTTGGGGIPMKGDDIAHIPSSLPDFLAAVKEGDTDKVASLVDGGGDVSEALTNGMNGLHIACIAGSMQMADLLIRRGLKVNSEVANGLTAMHLAVQSNNQGMVGLLLAKKANPNHPNRDGRTPLHWCAAVCDPRLDPANRFKMAQVLVRGGGDCSIRDNEGKTPAALADEGGEGKVADAFR